MTPFLERAIDESQSCRLRADAIAAVILGRVGRRGSAGRNRSRTPRSNWEDRLPSSSRHPSGRSRISRWKIFEVQDD